MSVSGDSWGSRHASKQHSVFVFQRSIGSVPQRAGTKRRGPVAQTVGCVLGLNVKSFAGALLCWSERGAAWRRISTIFAQDIHYILCTKCRRVSTIISDIQQHAHRHNAAQKSGNQSEHKFCFGGIAVQPLRLRVGGKSYLYKS